MLFDKWIQSAPTSYHPAFLYQEEPVKICDILNLIIWE